MISWADKKFEFVSSYVKQILVVTPGVTDHNTDVKHLLKFPSVPLAYYDKIYGSCVK